MEEQEQPKAPALDHLHVALDDALVSERGVRTAQQAGQQLAGIVDVLHVMLERIVALEQYTQIPSLNTSDTITPVKAEVEI